MSLWHGEKQTWKLYVATATLRNFTVEIIQFYVLSALLGYHLSVFFQIWQSNSRYTFVIATTRLENMRNIAERLIRRLQALPLSGLADLLKAREVNSLYIFPTDVIPSLRTSVRRHHHLTTNLLRLRWSGNAVLFIWKYRKFQKLISHLFAGVLKSLSVVGANYWAKIHNMRSWGCQLFVRIQHCEMHLVMFR